MLKLSQRIKHYRQKKGLSQEAVAKVLGVQRENYIKYESGERNPRDERIIEIAKILDTSYNALTEGVEREFIDLIHRHVSGAVRSDFLGFHAFYSDVIENEAFWGISACFSFWEEKFKVEASPFYEKFISNPSLKSLIELHDLYKLCLDAFIEKTIVPKSIVELEIELEAEPPLEDEATYRLAFCVAMTKYLTNTDCCTILEEAGQAMTGTDISPLQFFAVKIFVPFLSYIVDTLEMTMWNSTIDDFDDYFLYAALTVFDAEVFDDDSTDTSGEKDGSDTFGEKNSGDK